MYYDARKRLSFNVLYILVFEIFWLSYIFFCKLTNKFDAVIQLDFKLSMHVLNLGNIIRYMIRYIHLFLEQSDIRDDIMFKPDVTQALLMLILSKSPANVLKKASNPTYLKQSSNIR